MRADERLALTFLHDHPADAARLLDSAMPADAAAILAEAPAPAGAALFRSLAPSAAAACAAALDDGALAAIISALPLDAAAAAMRSVEPDRRDRVLDRLPEETHGQLRLLLSYPERSAGAISDPLVLALPDDITVGEAQHQLRDSHQHLFHDVYVVTRDRVLVGVLSVPELMTAPPKAPLAHVLRRDPIRLDAHTDVATVAAHPAWHDVDALPVVDSTGRLVGAIRHRTIRRLSRDSERPMLAALVGLSELYWAGLSGILTSLAPAQPAAGENTDVA